MTVINIWHIIENKWVHLTQHCYNDKTIMYVDGKISGRTTHES